MSSPLAADALAPCIAKSSAAMLSTMYDKYVLVFNNTIAVSSQYEGMVENTDTRSFIPKSA